MTGIKSLLISLLGHIAIFSIFAFSFGQRIPKANTANISFWGESFTKPNLASQENFSGGNKTKALIRRAGAMLSDNVSQEPFLKPRDYLRPQVPLILSREKMLLLQEALPELLMPKKREPALMFYPSLPYNFSLYFKDREVAHIELMFGVFSNGMRNSIGVKRKISSGNLEVDLLAMRYISRYLFIQQKVFDPNNWQTVKIDLSAKGP